MLLTGIPSLGKTRLKAALEAAHIPGDAHLHIHAETDLEAWLDPEQQREESANAAQADIVIPVDWESPDDSVKRVIAVLANGAGRGA